MFVKKELPDIFDWGAVSSFIISVLDVAKDGLKRRGLGEEAFLEPLYMRAEQLLSPARQMLNGLEQGRSVDDYIKEYGRL